MGSFSDRTSVVVVVKEGGEEANGFSVRSGMVLVVIKGLLLVSLFCICIALVEYGSGIFSSRKPDAAAEGVVGSGVVCRRHSQLARECRHAQKQ
jgi:hypothetical protein